MCKSRQWTREQFLSQPALHRALAIEHFRLESLMEKKYAQDRRERDLQREQTGGH